MQRRAAGFCFNAGTIRDAKLDAGADSKPVAKSDAESDAEPFTGTERCRI